MGSGRPQKAFPQPRRSAGRPSSPLLAFVGLEDDPPKKPTVSKGIPTQLAGPQRPPKINKKNPHKNILPKRLRNRTLRFCPWGGGSEQLNISRNDDKASKKNQNGKAKQIGRTSGSAFLKAPGPGGGTQRHIRGPSMHCGPGEGVGTIRPKSEHHNLVTIRCSKPCEFIGFGAIESPNPMIL